MMFSNDSPFLNIPQALDARQALYIDGLRHAAQIADLAYRRLCSGLTEHVLSYCRNERPSEFTYLYLDAWAFIDATDRFRSLWKMQPGADSMPGQFAPAKVQEKLEGIRQLRNVSAHVAQKIDQIVSLKSSVLGSLSWVTAVSQTPLVVKTCVIRPGVMPVTVSDQLAMPAGRVDFVNDSGWITMNAGKHKVVLSEAYTVLIELVNYAEKALSAAFSAPAFEKKRPADMLGMAELDTGKHDY
ncbi:hypothetical protein NYO91_18085 [Arhodomonas aquaeolei]|uniref:hypothetical protein n=1 Tax=Arhodomonas aquaeolei TaxID=2369 RepID=UPI0021671D65|nr:hypothetical protein [Arhodomonas aquaeolei]MCS4505993.1 hypothetical protein [Arhodomonas aquaeolei]